MPMPPPERKRFWITGAVALKLSFFSFFLYEAHYNGYDRGGGLLYRVAGDTDSYISPAEHLLSSGEYVQDPARPLTRAGRMPAYSLTYLLFRTVGSENAAKSMLALFQVLMSGVSTYFLSCLAMNLFGGAEAVFLSTFILYGLSTFVSHLDVLLLTESLSTSSLIFAAYCLERFKSRQRSRLLISGGAWLTYSIFLRPYVAVVLPLFASLTWVTSDGGKPSIPTLRRVLNTALLALPFAVCDSAWVARNYLVFGKFVPSQINILAGYQEPETHWAFLSLCQATGEDMVYWKPGTLSAWFFPQSRFPPHDYRPPPHVFTTDYDFAALDRIRGQYRHVLDQGKAGIGGTLDLSLARELNFFRDSYRRERPLEYYLLSRIRLTKILLVHSGPQNMPFKPFGQLYLDPPAMLVKLLSIALYWVTLAGGFTAIVFLWRASPIELRLYLLVPIWVIFLLAFILRSTEEVYWTPVYPFMTMYAAAMFAAIQTQHAPPVNS